MVDATGTTTYTYEPGGLVTKVAAPASKMTQYSYDTAGRRRTMTYPDGTTAT